jgi:hypothetical protein
MLEQAIIDAEQLKEAAQKNAEEVVIEKYQDEIRSAVETILEQEEGFDASMDEQAEMGTDEDGDLAFVEDLPTAQKSDASEVVTIDLDKLEEMMAEEMEDGTLDASDMADREAVAEEIDAVLNEDDEEIELDEEALREILDEEIDLSALTEDEDEDKKADASIEGAQAEEQSAEGGGTQGNTEADEQKTKFTGEPNPLGEGTDADLTEDDAEEKAQETDESSTEFSGPGHGGGRRGKLTKAPGTEKKDVPVSKRKFEENRSQAKENRSLLKEQKKLGSKVRLLEEKLDKYGTVILQLKEKLEDSNLVNARLLYQNRVLNSVSLNERQKDRIVEAISNAQSVEEARIVFETLQSAVGSTSKRKRPESLNEVVTRSSSAFIPRNEETKKDSSFADRMRTLAGIPTE